MKRGSLDSAMATVANYRDQVETARAKNLRDRMHAIAGSAERPIETSPRDGKFSRVGETIAGLALILPAPRRSDVEQLEALERELYEILARAAPSTWSFVRRSLVRNLRLARREIRAAERRTLDA